MFNVSLIKEIQITKDVNFVYKDIKGDEYDDTDIITKNFPLRPTINEFYKTFKEKFEKEFKTQLNSTTKIKDLSDMKTSFIFDKTFDDLLENTKELAPIWANRTEEEYKEYIKDLKAYFKSYYKLIQGAEYNLTLKPKDLMLNDELYFKSIKPETYKRLFKSIEPTINKFYKTFKKEFEKEFKTQINSAKKTKDLSNMIASFIFDKTFDDSLKNTKLLAPIKKNKTKKE